MIRRMFIAMVCLCFSLFAGNDRSLLLQSDKLGIQNQDSLSGLVAIVDFIAIQSGDQELCDYVDFFLATQNQIQRFSYYPVMIDRSLKDFKKTCSWNDTVQIHDFLYKKSDYHYPTVSFLLSMQRDNRSLVKNVIQKLEKIPDSDCLQISLQQLFHALHEVKKEIVTIDKGSVINAWYIYVTLLFLNETLIKGFHCIESAMQHTVNQQAVMHDMLYLSERFKRSILSGLTIIRGYNEKN